LLQQPLMTREASVTFLRERGFPISLSTLEKLSMPSAGNGPAVAKYWGRRPLYSPAELLAWAEARCRIPERAA
jgi:hypothetical protein